MFLIRTLRLEEGPGLSLSRPGSASVSPYALRRAAPGPRR
ncbi:hypothetical protein SLI_7481 [Streptomyces lividans 1326]|uniref:Uncharacterized protein n=1 Tax=Streptomyces lividans 1326 TaxID=1200984 RepID=A0A7U9DZS0_STRLI|nr:hypothetical protein SLI_7481 [Streptomyces lividans 1326]